MLSWSTAALPARAARRTRSFSVVTRPAADARSAPARVSREHGGGELRIRLQRGEGRQIVVQPGERGRERRAVAAVAQVGVDQLAVGAVDSAVDVLAQPFLCAPARGSARPGQDRHGQVSGHLVARALEGITRRFIDEAAVGTARGVRQRPHLLVRRQDAVEQALETVDEVVAVHRFIPAPETGRRTTGQSR